MEVDTEKAKWAIEFWCAIAELENDLAQALEDARQQLAAPPVIMPKWYAQGAMSTVVPLLLNCLTMQVGL